MTNTDWKTLLRELDFERLAGSGGEERPRRHIGARLEAWGTLLEKPELQWTKKYKK